MFQLLSFQKDFILSNLFFVFCFLLILFFEYRKLQRFICLFFLIIAIIANIFTYFNFDKFFTFFESIEIFQIFESKEFSIVERLDWNDVNFVSINSNASINFNSWNMLNQKIFMYKKTKSSLNSLIKNDDERFMLWIVKTKNVFEKWFLNDTSWNENTKNQQFKHVSIIWINKNRKSEFWHENINVNQNCSYVICQTCGFSIVHFSLRNIEINIMICHWNKFIVKCIVKINDFLNKQITLTTNFTLINIQLNVMF